MPTKRITQLFQDLSFDKKLIGIGSFLLGVSVFLPWYEDRDTFNTGDMFLGITGPLYLVGFSLLALAALNLYIVVRESSGKKVSFFPFKSSSLFLASGIFVFYMLMVVSSVYFHQKFGINLTWKQSQFGMFGGFIAASLMTIGGYLSGRDREAIMKQFQQESASLDINDDSFIHMPQHQQQKPSESLRTVHVPPIRDSKPRKDEEKHSEHEDSKPQPFRMDL